MTTTIEDDPNPERSCSHPEHEPPMHVVIPQGKILRHVCPGCCREIIVRPLQITFSTSTPT